MLALSFIAAEMLFLVGADPGAQATPSGWPTDLDGLNTMIYEYLLSPVSYSVSHV